MKNPTHSFRKMNFVFQIELRIKDKTVVSWGLRKKDSIFCTVYFVQMKCFSQFVFYLNV